MRGGGAGRRAASGGPWGHGGRTGWAGIRAGMGSRAKGRWRRSTKNHATGAALVPDTLTDLGEGACFNDARVEVASLANA